MKKGDGGEGRGCKRESLKDNSALGRVATGYMNPRSQELAKRPEKSHPVHATLWILCWLRNSASQTFPYSILLDSIHVLDQ